MIFVHPALAEPGLITYPETEKGEQVDVYHGRGVADPYRWLEDDRSPETAAWVETQNEVTFGFLEAVPFRAQIQERLKQLMDYERVSSPFKRGAYEYFYKNDGLQNHAVLYRTKLGAPEGEPEVFLDPNSFSKDGTVGLSGISFTEDGTLAAYMITEGGSDWRKIYVIDAETKEIVEEPIVDVKFSAPSWYRTEGFYYSSYENPEGAEGSQLSTKTDQHRLYYHRLGTPQSEDQVIFGDDEPIRYVGGGVTEDQRYLVVTAAQNTSGNQVYIRDLAEPDGEFVMVTDDLFSEAEVITNDGSRFLMLTNIGAPNYRVVSFEFDSPEEWATVIPETTNVLDVSTVGGKLFAHYLVDAKSEIKVFSLDGALETEIDLPGIGSAHGFHGKSHETETYFGFASFTYPTTVFRYDLKTEEVDLYRMSEVDFDPEAYETKQVFFESRDGTRVPMFIVHKKGLKLDGQNPTYLYSYGGFNISLTPSFNPSRIAWLEQGGVYAMPNIRGGGEYGRNWHLAGTRMNKLNVFDDFIAAGEYLIDNGYTNPERLAIAGGSNGGLLVGATMTRRPDLARVAVPAVGVLDMLRYHTFTAGAGWAADYGTVDDSPEMFEYLLEYSPYHALEPGVSYPATLITTADHDDRVVPAHSFKFAARLQEYHGGEAPVMIRIQTRAGHGSVSTEQRLALEADVYSFIWANMRFTPKF